MNNQLNIGDKIYFKMHSDSNNIYIGQVVSQSKYGVKLIDKISNDCDEAILIDRYNVFTETEYQSLIESQPKSHIG